MTAGERNRSIADAVRAAATVALGLSAGAMLAEGAVLVPWWRALPPQAFLTWYAANAARLFDFFGTLEIASAAFAVAALALSWYRPRARRFFSAAAVLALAVLAPFPLYFEAVNDSFANGTIALDRVAGELTRWSVLHWVRTGIGIAAFGAALLGVRSEAGSTVV